MLLYQYHYDTAMLFKFHRDSAMSDLMGSQQAVVPDCCPAVLRKHAKGA